MRGRVVDVGATRDDSERIDRRVAAVVMLLNVLHVHRAANSGDLEYFFGVVEDVGIFAQ